MGLVVVDGAQSTGRHPLPFLSASPLSIFRNQVRTMMQGLDQLLYTVLRTR
jgi:hypothetical protein